VANLLQEIEEQIAGAKRAGAWRNVGVIREIGDGVAKIEGLTDAMVNEMIDLGRGITGLALNLERPWSALSSWATLNSKRAVRSAPADRVDRTS
jgi:F0F1-type ATP synthase alpha subunit